MANGSANQPEASDQFPLAKLVAERRREVGLTLAEVARLMDRAAEEADSYCLANRQAIHEYEHGRIPYNGRLRLLAAALGVSFAEALAAAERQRAHRQIARAAGSILGDAADGGGPADPATTGVSSPGANRRPPGAPSPARVVIATFPDSEHAWLAGGTDPTSTARPTWGTGHEEGLILQAAARQPGDNEKVNRRQLLIDLAVLGLAAPLMGGEAVRQGLAAAVAGGRHAVAIDEWDRIVHEYARLYCVTPTDRLLRDLIGDLSVLQPFLEGSDGAAQRGLARVGAHLAAISAVAWADVGESAYAGRWWRTARQLADHSGDLQARTWVRGREVVNGLYEQRPVSTILDRAAEAASIAGPLASVGSAFLYCGLAQTLAVAGREDEALAALRRVAEVSEHLPASVVADEGSMFGWPEVRLPHTESYVHTSLGNTPAGLRCPGGRPQDLSGTPGPRPGQAAAAPSRLHDPRRGCRRWPRRGCPGAGQPAGAVPHARGACNRPEGRASRAGTRARPARGGRAASTPRDLAGRGEVTGGVVKYRYVGSG
jgi:transcriptional regulator with XRE-family HTH domain